MGQVKSAYHDLMAYNLETQPLAPLAPLSPSTNIYLLMDCSVPVAAYMHKALAEHDMNICIEGAEREEQPDLHDYWIKPLPMSMASD